VIHASSVTPVLLRRIEFVRRQTTTGKAEGDTAGSWSWRKRFLGDPVISGLRGLGRSWQGPADLRPIEHFDRRLDKGPSIGDFGKFIE